MSADQNADFASEHESLTTSSGDRGPEQEPEPESPRGYGGMDVTAADGDSGGGERHAAHAYPAPAEVVYDIATDLRRLSRLLPADLHVSILNNNLVQVTRRQRDAGGYEVSVHREDMSVTWRPIGRTGWPGALRVRQDPTGGSTAELSLESHGTSGDPPDVLDEALRRLEREVAENSAAG